MNEMLRKSVHLLSSIIPTSYFYLEKNTMIFAVGFLFALCAIFDLLRIKFAKMNQIFMQIFKSFTRDFESDKPLGSTYFLAGCFLTIVFFDKNIAIISMLILIFCDTFACFFGKLINSPKMVGNKTLAGFCGFLFSSLIISFFYSKYLNLDFQLFIIPCCISAMCELYSKKLKIDDNLLIPLSFAICLKI